MNSLQINKYNMDGGFDIVEYLDDMATKVADFKKIKQNHEHITIAARNESTFEIGDLDMGIKVKVQHVLHTVDYMTERLICQLEYAVAPENDNDSNPRDGKKTLMIDQQVRGDELDLAITRLYSAAYQTIINNRFEDEYLKPIKMNDITNEQENLSQETK